MNFRRLGKTNINVSEISLGTWQVGGGWGQKFDNFKAAEIIETALSQGVNFLDTADVYDDQQSERIVGNYVKKNRDQLYIATKIGRRVTPHVSEGYTPKILDQYVTYALKNTGLDYLDLVQLHCPPAEVYHREEIYRKLEEIKSSGRVRHFGVSVEKVEEAIKATEYEVIETVQIIFNMFRQKPLDECFDILKSRDIGIIVRVPLASGLLSGKMSSQTTFNKHDHRNFNRNGELFDKGETFSGVPLTAGFQAVDRLKEIFEDQELYKYALRWILMFDEVSTIIPGASRPDQVVSNVNSSEIPEIDHELMLTVKKVYDELIKSHVKDLW